MEKGEKKKWDMKGEKKRKVKGKREEKKERG